MMQKNCGRPRCIAGSGNDSGWLRRKWRSRNDSVSDAAGNEAAALTEAKTTPYGRYPETITYTLAKMTGVNNSNLPEGRNL